MTHLAKNSRSDFQYSAKKSILNSADEQKCKNLKQHISKCKSDVSSCAIVGAKLESEVAKLKKAIKSVGGSKLKKEQAAYDNILALIHDKQNEIRTSKVGITSSRKAKAEAAKAEAEKELTSCI